MLEHLTTASDDVWREIASAFRSALQELAAQSADVVLSRFPAGCCKTATFLFVMWLREHGYAGPAAYCDGHRRSGANLMSHGWLDVDGLTIDLTAAQFSDAPDALVLRESPWHAAFDPAHRHVAAWSGMNPEAAERYESMLKWLRPRMDDWWAARGSTR